MSRLPAPPRLGWPPIALRVGPSAVLLLACVTAVLSPPAQASRTVAIPLPVATGSTGERLQGKDKGSRHARIGGRTPGGPGQGAGPLPWRVRRGKHLLLLCQFGRLSNQVRCLRKTFLVAAMLNRSLILPPHGAASLGSHPAYLWSWDSVLDWRRLSSCLAPLHGPGAVVPLRQYLREAGKRALRVERVQCLARGPLTNCLHPWKAQPVVDAAGPGLQTPSMDNLSLWLTPSTLPAREVTPDDIIQRLGHLQDDVICVGEMFGVPLAATAARSFFSGMPPGCTNPWRPHPAIVQFMEGFIDTFLGRPFAALHLRRGDFYREAWLSKRRPPGRQRKQPQGVNATDYLSDYRPIADVAALVRQRLSEMPDLHTLFVASDAYPVEFRLLKDLLQDDSSGGQSFPRVVSLSHLGEQHELLRHQSWAQCFFHLNSAGGNGVAIILADKGIASRAAVFLGSPWSTFSMDIVEIRRAEGTSSPFDSWLFDVG